MKTYFYYFILLLLLLAACDNIDNLNQIAGMEDFGLVIKNPGEDSFIKTGEDCIIKWSLALSKARKLNIELISDKGIIQPIVAETENDGEYTWEKVEGLQGDKYSVRLTIVGGVYSGKYAENSFTLVKYMPGTIWFEPAEIKAESSSQFTMELHLDTGKQKLAAYGIDIDFNPSIISVDTSEALSGVKPGEDGFLSAVNANESGKLRIAGFNAFGTGPAVNMQLVTIYFFSLGQGNTDLNIYIRDLSDPAINIYNNPQGKEAKVTVY